MQPRTEGTPLRGGTANRGRVIRTGGLVHRPRGAQTTAVHALLRHLRESGFDGAPEVVGIGPRTEVLGYIEGQAATDPLPAWALTEEALASVGELLRDYHRHAATFDARGRRWQRPVPRAWRGPLVTHNDLHPANVIFRDGRAVALIDFDLAAPGTPQWDLAVTACFWAPLRDASDVADSRRDDRIRRFRVLLDAYGADLALRREVADAVGAANRWIADIIEDAARRGHPAFGRLWQGAGGMHRRAALWLAGHTDELLEAGCA